MTALLVAAAGGHLQQLHDLQPRIPGAQDAVWVTFDTAQSRSMLEGQRVVHAAYPQPRSVLTNARNAVLARRLLRQGTFDLAVSTGSSVAVSFLPLAAAMGVPSHYIESATRVSGPSTTGRILQRVPGIALHTQYPAWAGGRWHHGGSIFDGFEPTDRPARPIRRVVVTVGTAEGFGFRALIERALAVIPSGAEVTWQTGPTDTSGLDLDAEPAMASDRFRSLLAEADVIISHAGTGSSLAALHAGRCPVLVPRRAEQGEHVDDHQREIARELAGRGLALHREVDELRGEDLVEASRRGVVRTGSPPTFRLCEP
jgi:UDP-N-acetylglucosamine transferase subunit ALG13